MTDLTPEQRAELRAKAEAAGRVNRWPHVNGEELGPGVARVVLALLDQLEHMLKFAPRCCNRCGEPAEPERWVYVTPVCYACLPPPEPIPTLELDGPR